MPKPIKKTPDNSLFELLLRIWKEHTKIIAIITIFVLVLIGIMLYCQCAANTGRTWQAVIWNDFKIVGWYVFGLISPAIISMISKFHNYLNK